MTAKELRQSLRRGSFVYPFLAIQLLAVVAVAVEFKFEGVAGTSKNGGMLNVLQLGTSGLFWMVVALICLIVMPLSGLFLMRQELEEGNHELLLLTQLSRWQVVRGKFLALWGLCALTFFSLLPYGVVRYMVGGVEWWHEMMCGGTILGGSAMICAGAIGASAFMQIGVRIAVFALYLFSLAVGCAFALSPTWSSARGAGWLYHFTALAAVVGYTVAGLAVARSRLRLSLLAYEAHPTGMILVILGLAPFIIGVVTGFTCGVGGAIGLLGFPALMLRLDEIPRVARRRPPPLPNSPPPLT